MMQKVLAQMDDMQKEGKEQQATIQELQRLLLESQQQDQETRRQLQDTKQQLKEVREQLEAIMKFPGMTSSTHSNAQASYAEVARTPPTSQPTNVRTLSSMNTTPSTFTDTLFCTVDTSRVEEADRSKVHAGSVRVAVEKEMRTRREDDSWRCKAVTVDTKNANRIKIVCRDEAEHNMVKQAAERMELASGVRVSRDELYPVKVDNVNRTAVLDESGSIRLGAAQAFGQENEATVAKVSWLSKRDIPKAYGSMESRSGATFEADKTAIIHFSRNAERLDGTPYTIKGRTVSPKEEVKILGVILDQQLRYKNHIARAATKGLKAAMALRRLRGLAPSVARQLFTSTVAPVVDYASCVWMHACGETLVRSLNRVQNVSAQSIVGTFRTVATVVAEAEASIPTVRQRFATRATTFWIGMHALRRNHPLVSATTHSTRRFTSPLQRIAAAHEGIPVDNTETIKPFALGPCRETSQAIMLRG
ncbi:hypothetical protein HYQ44_001086 [Verticillium longisporum]|nr:hypothetical protein HYQ44_001086 [Verticillium longisporum]